MSEFCRDPEGHACTRNGDRISDIRSKLSGWHFAKECLTPTEREMLYVAEQLMDELDRLAGGFLQ